MQTRSRPEPAGDAFVLPLRVYYEDTDAAGIVYYANYLRYCERARTEWLRALGFEQQRLRAERGLVFVVKSVHAEYMSPALLDDALELRSVIETLGRASLAFRQQVLRNGVCLFDARVVIACVDLVRNRPVAMPAEIREQFEHVLPSPQPEPPQPA
ncbi:putative thioesterase [Azoarcus olearius]|uniref:tol-pal system-associated acyl-CoA thioesterase n=1 Tax=Azoarcus sp. (strain BH72) TaxID=418699 RepID=UPI0008062F02|nr:tol-pal system-associated acyl-CoA thioesterase [Azoarcus olearius]ANQ83508.1 putative thioesterase [Azoarcus olearius]